MPLHFVSVTLYPLLDVVAYVPVIWTPLHVDIFPLFAHPPTYVSVPWLCAGICDSVSV